MTTVARYWHSMHVEWLNHNLQIFQKISRHEICCGLKEAEFDIFELKAAGFSVGDLYPVFDLASLKSAGYDFSALASAGFSAAELTAVGFSSEVKV
jgi:hypothetical protein